MLRHACGFALANKGHGTRALQGLSRSSQHPAHRAIYRAVTDAVQGLLAELTHFHGSHHADVHIRNNE
jgi:hypothetical protein